MTTTSPTTTTSTPAHDASAARTREPSSPQSRAGGGGMTTKNNTKNSKQRRVIAKTVRRVLLAVFVIAVAAAIALAFRPKPVLVDLVTASRGPLSVSVEETGMTRVKDRYVVSASVTGSMSRLDLEPGDAVKEGDVLVTIAPATSPLLDERSRGEAEARLSSALSALGQARAQELRASTARGLSEQELDRTRKLVASGSMARQVLEEQEFQDRMRAEEWSSASFAAKVANEEVRRARAVLSRETGSSSSSSASAASRSRSFDVLAPTSGRVLRVLQKSAGVVQPGAPLLEMGDDAILEVVVDLVTTDAVRVRVGTPVTIQDWGGDRPLAGRVRKIEPSAFTRPSALGVDEQRVNVVVALTDPHEQWSELRDGYHVEVRFVLWRSENVLRVPNGAVFRRGDGWAVFRIDDSHHARLTTVTVGHRGEGEIEILSGLEPGNNVAVHPGDSVKDGVKVAARGK